MVCVTTFFQLRDHYLEVEKCGHTTKMRVTTIFPLSLPNEFWKNSGYATKKMWSHKPYIWLTEIFSEWCKGD